MLVILEGNKNGNPLGKISLSDEEIIPFERYNTLRCAKIGTKDVTLQNKLHHFQTSEKAKILV